jgi:putative transposase
MYFITICTFHHRQLFGEIQNGEMRLDGVGRLAAAQWLQLEFRFSGLELGEWVIMPNHLHGILIITGRGEASQQKSSPLSTVSVKDASPLRPNIAKSDTK